MQELKIKNIKTFLEQIINTTNQLSLAEMLRVMGYIEGLTAQRSMP